MRVAWLTFLWSASFAIASGQPGIQVVRGPLEVANAVTHPHQRGAELEFDVANSTHRPLLGYVVSVEVVRNGKVVSTFSHAGAASGRNYFNAGDVEHVKGFIVRNAVDKTFRITTDFLLFADSTSWGPDKRKKAAWVVRVVSSRQPPK